MLLGSCGEVGSLVRYCRKNQKIRKANRNIATTTARRTSRFLDLVLISLSSRCVRRLCCECIAVVVSADADA